MQSRNACSALFSTVGAEIVNRRFGDRCQATYDQRFRATFGTTPNICSILWQWIYPDALLSRGAKPKHLLWALAFLKMYDTEPALSILVGGVDERTYRKWIWELVEAIADLESIVIDWENRFQDDIGNECLVSVNCIDFRIQEQTPVSNCWYSNRLNGPGLRYEVGLTIHTGNIIWVQGPCACGSWPDIKIFRNGMKHYLESGERVEADEGYRGDWNVMVPCNSLDVEPDILLAMRRRVAARQDTVNKRLKQWGCLKQIFLHDIGKHSAVFRAVAVITQLAIENGEPLFTVDQNHAGSFAISKIA